MENINTVIDRPLLFWRCWSFPELTVGTFIIFKDMAVKSDIETDGRKDI